MGFEFYTAPRIVFESGAVKKLPSICAGFGKHYLIVTGGSSLRRFGVLDTLLKGMEKAGIKCTVFDGVTGEPTPETVDAAVQCGIHASVDAVLGIGGGSAMDTAKAAAGVIPNGGSVLRFLEGVGTGAKIIADPLPFIAVPTTAGTGTEVTKNAVIMSAKDKFKVSMRDERLLARVAVVDPALTVPVPPDVTAASGMDAICQLIESFTTRHANDFCDAMALYHTSRAMDALRRVYADGNDLEAREAMSLAALVSGMCLANSGLGAAHGIGAGLGAVRGVTHGVACGMLLPHVMRYNIAHGITKYAALADAVCGKSYTNETDAALAVADSVAVLCADVGLPSRLGELGVTADMAEELATASMGSSMSKNPVAFTQEECAKFILSLI
jgi:alcohol dehydrogenase class IV